MEIFKTLGTKGVKENLNVKSNSIPNIKNMIFGKFNYYTSGFDFY
jgi:hypothetical protein